MANAALTIADCATRPPTHDSCSATDRTETIAEPPSPEVIVSVAACAQLP